MNVLCFVTYIDDFCIYATVSILQRHFIYLFMYLYYYNEKCWIPEKKMFSIFFSNLIDDV